MIKEDMDKELKETIEKIDMLMQKMQQEAQRSWRYESPLKKRVKCPIQQLISMKKKHMLRRWLMQVEDLRNT
jgi:hypothetical protein